jgi:small-conductance mechanosensitive channel
MVGGINLIFKVLVWIFGIIFLLDNLGFKVKSLMTGIGIGGVAIALATQKVLADLFSYFAILLDRPFKIGDFLIIDNHLGVVEHIGIKTTRIRSLHGEELIFSNNDLLNSRIKNYISMQERRVLFNIGVTYSTPAEKLEKIPEIIKSIIENIEDTRFDRCHFSKYGDFNLIIEVVYYIKGADYNKYMDIQQKVNLNIKRKFEEEGIKFAFPTQTVHLENKSELKE